MLFKFSLINDYIHILKQILNNAFNKYMLFQISIKFKENNTKSTLSKIVSG